jgi:hypothetical protein
MLKIENLKNPIISGNVGRDIVSPIMALPIPRKQEPQERLKEVFICHLHFFILFTTACVMPL